MLRKTKTQRLVIPPLQPLKIPSGWTIDLNDFYEVDPSFKRGEDTHWNFKADMLHLIGNRGVEVWLDWLPEHRRTGRFILRAMRSGPLMPPLRSLCTRSRVKVVKALEGWLQWYADNDPPPPRDKRTGRPKR